MPLPHPHGSASGQIGFGSLIDTGNPPSGSPGGKFIGFGEDGTSPIANRAHWALSENIDYVYQILASDLAMPAGASWVVPGGGSATFQFTGDVWVGDGSYPAIEDEGLLLLFSVLDDQYNELEDGSGNEVRVSVVRDSTNTTNVYQGGFVTDPVITFKTVDPTTGADVVDPYTVPVATNVRILYAEQGNLENVPTDAFIKFKVHSGAEVEAGAFLQDGTRQMTGDADWDGNKLLNIDELRGASGADLLVRSQQDLTVQGDQELLLKDQHLSAAVPLSETGVSALLQPTDSAYNASLISSMNSQISISNLLRGNRPLNRTGTFTANVAGPTLDYPVLDLMINGEIIQVPAGNINLSALSTGDIYVYYDQNGFVSAVNGTFYPSSLPEGAIVFWKGTWNGAVWSSEVDLRWPADRQTTHESWYVGDGMGADFADLNLLRTVVNGGLWKLPPSKTHKVREVVVVGTATVTETYFLDEGWTIRGAVPPTDSPGIAGESVIQTDVAFAPATDVIWCLSDATVKDLKLIWNNTSAHQSAGYGIRGNTSTRVERVVFDDNSTYSFNSVIGSGDCQVIDCDMSAAGYQQYGVDCTGNYYVERCKLGPGSAGDGVACAHLSGGNNVIKNCTVQAGGPGSYFFYVTDDHNVIRDCYADFAALGTIPFVELYAGSGSIIGLSLKNNHLTDGYKFVVSTIDSFAKQVRFFASGNVLTNFANRVFDFAHVNVDNDSTHHISDNIVQNVTTGPAVYISDGRAWVNDNMIFNVTGALGGGINLIGTYGNIKGNYIKSTGYGVKTNYAELIVTENLIEVQEQSILIDNTGFGTTTPAVISNNRFWTADAGYSMVEIHGYSGATIRGNTFGVATNQDGAGIRCSAQAGSRCDYHVIEGNTFYNLEGNSGFAYDAVIAIESGAGAAPESCTISNNTFESCGSNTVGARDTHMIRADASSCTVSGNTIRNMKGPANASGDMKGIYSIGGEAVITGNSILTDLTDSGIGYGDIVGIQVDGGNNVVSNNRVHFTGSGATSTTGSIWGIAAAGTQNVTSGNSIGDFDISTAATQHAIASYSNDCVIIGNLAARHDIDSVASSGGMVIGNVTLNGSTLTGTNATSGNT